MQIIVTPKNERERRMVVSVVVQSVLMEQCGLRDKVYCFQKEG